MSTSALPCNDKLTNFSTLLFPRSVPSPESALNTAKAFATVPHLAGSVADLKTAEAMLAIFQNELGIAPPEMLPLFESGSELSRNATLSMTSNLGAKTAWIDTYYPVMNTPLDRHLQIIEDDGSVAWDADVEEEEVEGDPAGEHAKTIGAWHGLSKGGDVKVSVMSTLLGYIELTVGIVNPGQTRLRELRPQGRL